MKNKKLLKESIQDILNNMGYYQQNDETWKHEKTGKVLSDKHAQDIAAERAARKPARPWTAGGEGDPDMIGGNRFESLFHKDSDRLLREHIRAEYEARGIYPTSREVQETFNHVVDLLEKTRASQRDAILAQQHGTSGTKTGLKLTKQELRRRRAENSPQDYGDPARTSREEGERQGKHTSARGNETNISPSSPARQQSGVEQHTRKQIARSRRGNRSRGVRWFARNRGNDNTESLLKQGFSPDHLRRIMSDTGR